MDIPNVDTLKQVLQKHTGSKGISSELLYFFTKNLYFYTEYKAYARGRSTLIFKKITEKHIELLATIPRFAHSSSWEGINQTVLQTLEQHMGASWKICAAYRGELVVHTATILSEQQILELFPIGFTSVRQDLGSSAETILTMQR